MGEFRAGLGHLTICGVQVFRWDLVMLSVLVLMIKPALLYMLVHVPKVRFLRREEWPSTTHMTRLPGGRRFPPLRTLSSSRPRHGADRLAGGRDGEIT